MYNRENYSNALGVIIELISVALEESKSEAFDNLWNSYQFIKEHMPEE